VKIEDELKYDADMARKLIRSDGWKWYAKKLDQIADSEILLSVKPERFEVAQAKIKSFREARNLPEAYIKMV
jgi:hypothetical protein